MKCDEFKNNLIDIFDKNTDSAISKSLKEHISECEECRREYEEMKIVIERLDIDKTYFPITSDLKNGIINEINKGETKTKTVLKRWHKRLIAVAASVTILVSLFIFNNQNPFVGSVQAAEKIMLKSLNAMESLHSMFISMDVRSIEGESFDLIGEEYNFVEYNFWKQFSGVKPWKIKKPGRTACWDGNKQYLFIENIFYAITADENTGFVEWLKQFLDPKGILDREIAFTKANNAKYEIFESNDKIVLTVSAMAMGDFKNKYLKNHTVNESDNHRVYTFNKHSMLLESFSLFLHIDNKEIEVIRLKKINYNIPINKSTFSILLPQGVKWKALKEPDYQTDFSEVSSKKAAKTFFSALSNYDFETVTKIWDILYVTNEDHIEELKSYYGGIEIISIGEPFKSGLYPGEFVPYKIRFKSGKILEHNLALRNDNPNKVWVIDGGI